MYKDLLLQVVPEANVIQPKPRTDIATGTETLDKLDAYIRECNAVIHLVGDMTGALAQSPSVAVIRQRYLDFDQRLPVLSPFLQLGAPALSYASEVEYV